MKSVDGMPAPAAGLPTEAYAVALAALPAMGPSRLLALLRRLAPAAAWAQVLAGRGSADAALAASWRAAATRLAPSELWDRCRAAGIGVSLLGSASYPAVLAADPVPPAVVFIRGDPAAVDGPRVAVVGTRRCSRYGRDVAARLARDLADAGVRVVSGLALGIDGAAHAGALAAGSAPPIGVVGSGLDVVYPRRHAGLWDDVARAGLLLSEAPPGARPEPWRFPARNRLLASLADVVVVVESHAAGGSMLTVNEAVARDRPVMAVPGPVVSPSSAGTNDLLASGAHVARDAGDVLALLGMEPGGRRARDESRPPPSASDATVLDALGWQPATTDEVATAAGVDLATAAVALERLTAAGWVASTGGWWERVAGGGRAGEGSRRRDT
jgi:DNA processing protein